MKMTRSSRKAKILLIGLCGLAFCVFYQKKVPINQFLLKPHEKGETIWNKEHFYSENEENNVVYKILQRKRGFFLEIGVDDEHFFSNTVSLESKHDWNGLLVEPNPEICERIDMLERHAWRFCACLSDTKKSVTLTKGDRIDEITVPCFSLDQVVNTIGINYIDFISLHIEMPEMGVLESLKKGIKDEIITVDVWSIEFKIRNNKETMLEISNRNLNALRTFFNELGSFFEYKITNKIKGNNHIYNVLFIRSHMWCKTRKHFPNGTTCSKTDRSNRIKDYLCPPHEYKIVKDADKRYSQAKQDEVVYDILKMEGGFFVDIGAYDGQLFSNSLWLERKHNWTGLLIEANPDLCEKIDEIKRHAWRMCACLSDTLEKVTFIKAETLGGMQKEIDSRHIKLLIKNNKVTVPCFSLEAALDEIKTYHIDYFSLDVEGAEMQILESLRNGLMSKRFTVDVWTIEYRVWDGKIDLEKSLENLNALRNYFKEIGGYSEHSQIQYENDTGDGKALDVVFVKNEMFCKKYKTLPGGGACSNSHLLLNQTVNI